MAISNEHQSLLSRVTHLKVSLREKLEEKRQLEERIGEEIRALSTERNHIQREISSLQDRGILYCDGCNDLYELSETRFEHNEGRVVTEIRELDMYRYREKTAPGETLSYFCPRCDALLMKKDKAF